MFRTHLPQEAKSDKSERSELTMETTSEAARVAHVHFVFSFVTSLHILSVTRGTLRSQHIPPLES